MGVACGGEMLCTTRVEDASASNNGRGLEKSSSSRHAAAAPNNAAPQNLLSDDVSQDAGPRRTSTNGSQSKRVQWKEPISEIMPSRALADRRREESPIPAPYVDSPTLSSSDVSWASLVHDPVPVFAPQVTRRASSPVFRLDPAEGRRPTKKPHWNDDERPTTDTSSTPDDISPSRYRGNLEKYVREWRKQAASEANKPQSSGTPSSAVGSLDTKRGARCVNKPPSLPTHKNAAHKMDTKDNIANTSNSQARKKRHGTHASDKNHLHQQFNRSGDSSEDGNLHTFSRNSPVFFLEYTQLNADINSSKTSNIGGVDNSNTSWGAETTASFRNASAPVLRCRRKPRVMFSDNVVFVDENEEVLDGSLVDTDMHRACSSKRAGSSAVLLPLQQRTNGQSTRY
ncbi:hypothetical protein DQ04_00981030 [Trypanosoma grayi]|uniref:hypothetical protein n=1 Tax=Trypanosoma grayi TaxID=71804 RepID=UPI0004F436DE|nr:hypothetical protein DQ04_00981030 [Trypanosoma grayi]KEG13473.1 hypothetical protein DQ04_00981030 [Trypanosoma grayi]